MSVQNLVSAAPQSQQVSQRLCAVMKQAHRARSIDGLGHRQPLDIEAERKRSLEQLNFERKTVNNELGEEAARQSSFKGLEATLGIGKATGQISPYCRR